MTILVVEDHAGLRELIAHMVKNQREGIAVLEAECLDQARELLPEADAVLSDGSFPTHLPRWYDVNVGTTSSTNWAPLLSSCREAGVPFVLLSGNSELVRKLREEGYAAFEKPRGVFDAVRTVVDSAELRMLERLNSVGR